MKVKFVPQNVELEIPVGKSVMNLAHENGIPIRSTCNGMPSCAECRVKVVDGDWNVTPPSRKELSLIGTGYYIDQRRLSCQLLCFGDITVDTAEQLEKASEGPVTKKFLTKVHKASAEESHSVGGILIEQDGALLNQLKSEETSTAFVNENVGLSEGRRPQRDQRRNESRNRENQVRDGQNRDGRGGENRNGGGGGNRSRNHRRRR